MVLSAVTSSKLNWQIKIQSNDKMGHSIRHFHICNHLKNSKNKLAPKHYLKFCLPNPSTSQPSQPNHDHTITL